jgi:hypothetical protein
MKKTIVDRRRCPLYGNSNERSVAAGEKSCWCFSQPIPPGVASKASRRSVRGYVRVPRLRDEAKRAGKSVGAVGQSVAVVATISDRGIYGCIVQWLVRIGGIDAFKDLTAISSRYSVRLHLFTTLGSKGSPVRIRRGPATVMATKAALSHCSNEREGAASR